MEDLPTLKLKTKGATDVAVISDAVAPEVAAVSPETVAGASDTPTVVAEQPAPVEPTVAVAATAAVVPPVDPRLLDIAVMAQAAGHAAREAEKEGDHVAHAALSGLEMRLSELYAHIKRLIPQSIERLLSKL